jgi:aspartate--ammonia ligase
VPHGTKFGFSVKETAMSKLFIPKNYVSKMDVYRTQKAISFIKRTFQDRLAAALNLKRVSAPLFVTEASGLNDNLNGIERPVSFDIPAADGITAQVVQSLAKWKRFALKEYHFYVGNGLYTDMNAIRRDEELDNLHSIYVDQWDWEKVITKESRNVDYLKKVVSAIVKAICDTNDRLKVRYPSLSSKLYSKVSFVTRTCVPSASMMTLLFEKSISQLPKGSLPSVISAAPGKDVIMSSG